MPKLTTREKQLARDLMEIYHTVLGLGSFDGEDASPAILAAEIHRRAREEEDAMTTNSLTTTMGRAEPGYLIVKGDLKGKMIKGVEELPSGRTFQSAMKVTFLDGEVQNISMNARITVLGRHGIPIIHPLPGDTNDQ